jgi:prolipoprotein diacylglyceryltransferase
LSVLVTIPGMVATAFVVALVLGALMPARWKTIGWVLPLLAAAYTALRLATDHGSAGWSDILFAALWAAIGAFPGAAIGSWLYSRFRRSA